MAITYNHVQLSNVDADKDINVMYPVNMAKDVLLDGVANNAIPEEVTNLESLLNSLGTGAFQDVSQVASMSVEGDTDYTIGSDDEYNVVDQVSSVGNLTCNFTVDGTNIDNFGLCPEQNAYWVVEYFPLSIVDGEVLVAYQRWTGVTSSSEVVIYNRHYMNKVWSNFTK